MVNEVQLCAWPAGEALGQFAAGKQLASVLLGTQLFHLPGAGQVEKGERHQGLGGEMLI